MPEHTLPDALHPQQEDAADELQLRGGLKGRFFADFCLLNNVVARNKVNKLSVQFFCKCAEKVKLAVNVAAVTDNSTKANITAFSAMPMMLLGLKSRKGSRFIVGFQTMYCAPGTPTTMYMAFK